MPSIIKTTPSSITVQVEDKTLNVSGESFVRGSGSPDFVIDINSIKTWDAPHHAIAITEDEREIIVQYLLDELSRRNWNVTAE